MAVAFAVALWGLVLTSLYYVGVLLATYVAAAYAIFYAGAATVLRDAPPAVLRGVNLLQTISRVLGGAGTLRYLVALVVILFPRAGDTESFIASVSATTTLVVWYFAPFTVPAFTALGVFGFTGGGIDIAGVVVTIVMWQGAAILGAYLTLAIFFGWFIATPVIALQPVLIPYVDFAWCWFVEFATTVTEVIDAVAEIYEAVAPLWNLAVYRLRVFAPDVAAFVWATIQRVFFVLLHYTTGGDPPCVGPPGVTDTCNDAAAASLRAFCASTVDSCYSEQLRCLLQNGYDVYLGAVRTGVCAIATAGTNPSCSEGVFAQRFIEQWNNLIFVLVESVVAASVTTAACFSRRIDELLNGSFQIIDLLTRVLLEIDFIAAIVDIINNLLPLVVGIIQTAISAIFDQLYVFASGIVAVFNIVSSIFCGPLADIPFIGDVIGANPLCSLNLGFLINNLNPPIIPVPASGALPIRRLLSASTMSIAEMFAKYGDPESVLRHPGAPSHATECAATLRAWEAVERGNHTVPTDAAHLARCTIAYAGRAVHTPTDNRALGDTHHASAMRAILWADEHDPVAHPDSCARVLGDPMHTLMREGVEGRRALGNFIRCAVSRVVSSSLHDRNIMVPHLDRLMGGSGHSIAYFASELVCRLATGGLSCEGHAPRPDPIPQPPPPPPREVRQRELLQIGINLNGGTALLPDFDFSVEAQPPLRQLDDQDLIIDREFWSFDAELRTLFPDIEAAWEEAARRVMIVITYVTNWNPDSFGIAADLLAQFRGCDNFVPRTGYPWKSACLRFGYIPETLNTIDPPNPRLPGTEGLQIGPSGNVSPVFGLVEFSTQCTAPGGYDYCQNGPLARGTYVLASYIDGPLLTLNNLTDGRFGTRLHDLRDFSFRVSLPAPQLLCSDGSLVCLSFFEVTVGPVRQYAAEDSGVLRDVSREIDGFLSSFDLREPRGQDIEEVSELCRYTLAVWLYQPVIMLTVALLILGVLASMASATLLGPALSLVLPTFTALFAIGSAAAFALYTAGSPLTWGEKCARGVAQPARRVEPGPNPTWGGRRMLTTVDERGIKEV